MIIAPHPDDDRYEASPIYQALLVLVVTVLVTLVWFVVNDERQESDPVVAPVIEKSPIGGNRPGLRNN